MLVLLVNLLFLTLEGMMVAHLTLSWLRIGAARIPWLRHPVILWIDNAGERLLRPGRRLLEAVGLKRFTRPIDLSPMLSLTLLQWLHRLAVILVSR
jgi:YGGT family protein